MWVQFRARETKGWFIMKNYILKIWVATPECKEMQMLEYSASDFKGVETYIEWKRDRLALQYGENVFTCYLVEAWEAKKIYGRKLYEH